MKQRGGGPNAQAPRIAAYAHAGGKTTFWILTRGSVSREFARRLQWTAKNVV